MDNGKVSLERVIKVRSETAYFLYIFATVPHKCEMETFSHFQVSQPASPTFTDPFQLLVRWCDSGRSPYAAN